MFPREGMGGYVTFNKYIILRNVFSGHLWHQAIYMGFIRT